MNLYTAFSTEERELVSKLETIEDKEYTKDEINRIESKIIEDIMSNSKKNIGAVRDKYTRILNKLEDCNG